MDKNRLKNLLALGMALLLCFENLFLGLARHSIVYFVALFGALSVLKHCDTAYKNKKRLKEPLFFYILGTIILLFFAIHSITSELFY